MLTMKKHGVKPDSTIVYMEVYGVNRVIYRVTASTVRRKGRNIYTYGITLEDVRAGSKETIESFSDDMEYTIQFANSLVRKGVRPDGLYNEALRQLRCRSGKNAFFGM